MTSLRTAPERAPRASRVPADIVGQPLYSADAEKAVLGSMMACPEKVIDRVSEKLQRDDFFVPAHQIIFETLCQMHNGRVAIDITTVHQYLADRKLAEAVGSPGIIASLAAGLATYLNVGTYVQFVKDKSLLRHLQDACMKISQNIADNQEDVSTVLDQAEAEIWSVTRRATLGKKAAPISQLARERSDKLLAWNNARDVVGIPTGLRRLDVQTTGWLPGDFIVLSGESGKGKTAMAMNWIARQAAERWSEDDRKFIKPGYRIGIFSLEMTRDALCDRLFACYGGVPAQNMRRYQITSDDRVRLIDVSQEMAAWTVIIDDESGLSMQKVCSRARAMKEEHDIEILYIDYLQLLHSSSEQTKNGNREQEVAEISRNGKALARDLNIPVVVLCQENKFGDTRESSAIKNDSDARLQVKPRDPENKGPVQDYDIFIDKQRAGPCETVPLEFLSGFLRFVDAKGDI